MSNTEVMKQSAVKLAGKHPKNKIHRTAGDIAFDVFLYILFVAFTILCVFPFYYLFINTISSNDAVAGGLVNFWPVGIHFQNYLALRDVADLGSSVIVTVARTILGTALMVIVSAWAGYLVTKQKMWHRSLMYRALVITMYFNAGLIPWYMNMLMLGLTNNFLAYILPGMIAPYNIILVKTYIESIPASLEESAVIDGANTPTVFLKIILPLSVPILATISIFGAVGNWTRSRSSLLLMSSGRSCIPAAPPVCVPEPVLEPVGAGQRFGRHVHAGGGEHAQHARYQVHGRHGVDYPDSAGVPVHAAVLC